MLTEEQKKANEVKAQEEADRREVERWDNQTLSNLRGELKRSNLVIVVGSGVTLYSTAEKDEERTNLQRLKWFGLVRNGFKYFERNENISPEKRPRDLQHAYEVLDDKNSTTAQVLRTGLTLKDLLGGTYAAWLRDEFEKLEVNHPSILDSLKNLQKEGAILVTTNYDGLLENWCGLKPIDSSTILELRKFQQQPQRKGVFHPHGYWENPDSVVLNAIDYYKATTDNEVQETLKNMLGFKTVLFVGCGGGLNDPNFGPLLDWVGLRQKGVPYNLHLLLRKNDRNPVEGRPLNIIRCGHSSDSIAPWLNQLLGNGGGAEGSGE